MTRANRSILTVLVAVLTISPVLAQSPQALQSAHDALLKGVGITQNLGKPIPLNLVFKDSTGKSVKLGDYFKGKKPVILTLVYYDCPMLCTLVLNDLARSMNRLDTLSAGVDYQVVTVSFNPKETPDLAAQKKASYLQSYHRPHAADGWHFLTGDEASIHQLTEAVGFHYKWDANSKQYVHPSGITILTPTGTISRYFFGIDYDMKDLKLSLIQASGDKIGTLTDQILLYCCSFDPTSGKYNYAVGWMLKVGGALTLLALGALWLVLVRGHKPVAPIEPATEKKEE
jgi:protein SCO1/2